VGIIPGEDKQERFGGWDKQRETIGRERQTDRQIEAGSIVSTQARRAGRRDIGSTDMADRGREGESQGRQRQGQRRELAEAVSQKTTRGRWWKSECKLLQRVKTELKRSLGTI
jgi:hypothetical protein